MTERRNQLTHGLTLALGHGRAILWTYAANLGLALLFAVRVRAQLNDILTHSLASQRLSSAFDLGVVLNTYQRITENAPDTGVSSFSGLPLYVLIYFLLVPGALWCYQTGEPARLSTLLSTGLLHFWRFVRITLVTLVVSGAILGPLWAAHAALTERADKHLVGPPALVHQAVTLGVVALVAALLRLYFDLVEAYTVQLGLRIRDNGKPDRRVRRALLPALRTLFRGFLANYLTFLLLALLGFATLFLTGRIAVHTLAQPRVWPQFLLVQVGVLALLVTRYWQRGASTTLALNNPIPVEVIEPLIMPAAWNPPAPPPDPIPEPEPIAPSLAEPDAGVFHQVVEAEHHEIAPEDAEDAPLHPADPIPDPEPISPSLPEPDPGVFHHEASQEHRESHPEQDEPLQ
ncbi:hypothetical protein SAMN05421770_10643 [Granulicella rosea]|uniref:Uncharacterized protein n=1 Tax=Granulicella rosea TaxID=474952 RepID=A0A239L3W1_9BACT|nr:hypothetical protein [Granulicella rosea]SNT24389.1 hypothetical protein SAMN05421770_10643 [Granulicella rosea]